MVSRFQRLVAPYRETRGLSWRIANASLASEVAFKKVRFYFDYLMATFKRR